MIAHRIDNNIDIIINPSIVDHYCEDWELGGTYIEFNNGWKGLTIKEEFPTVHHELNKEHYGTT